VGKKPKKSRGRSSGKIRAVSSGAKLADTPARRLVYGRIETFKEAPAADLIVAAFDKDVGGENRLGEATTTATGDFRISYAEETFRRSKNERRGADIFLRVHDAQHNLLFTSKTFQNAARELRIDAELPEPKFVVRGRVIGARKGMLVVAYDQDLRSGEQVGKPFELQEDGLYAIEYRPSEFACAEKSSADLKIVVREGEQELHSSEILFNAGPDATVQLALPGAQDLPLSEYARYLLEIAPLLQGLTLAELDDKDVDFLAGDTGIERAHLVALVDASKLEREALESVTRHEEQTPPSELDAPVFYSWLRAGQSNKLYALLVQPDATLRDAFDGATRENRIAARSPEQIERVFDEWQQLKALDALHPAEESAAASLGDVLRTIPEAEAPSANESIVFARLRAAHGDSEELWQRAEEQGLSRAIPTLKRTVALENLTAANPPLMAALQQLRNEKQPDSIAYLAQLGSRDWIQVGLQYGPPPSADVPIGEYVEKLRSDVERQFPMEVLRAHLRREPSAAQGLPAKKISDFLERNVAFNLKTQHLEPFLAAQDVQDEELRSGLLKTQRLLAIGANSEEVGILAAAQFGSSSQIVDSGEPVFLAAISPQIAATRARELYAAASDVNSRTMAIASQVTTNFTQTNSTDAVPSSHPSSEILDQYPSLRTLFGDVDFCECRYCQSVLGPSAYLADLMHFLQRSSLSPHAPGKLLPANYQHPNPYLEYAVGGSVLGVLLQRRPDLADLELSCDNTDTEIPYIDLVLEILENAVALPMMVDTDALPLAGVDLDAEFRDQNVPPQMPHIVQVLKQTDIEVGAYLWATEVPRQRFSSLFLNDWIVGDGSRRWWLRHQQRKLILAVESQALLIANIDEAADALSRGELSAELVTSVERGLPLDGLPTITERPVIEGARVWTILYQRGIAIKVSSFRDSFVLEWFALSGTRLRRVDVSKTVFRQVGAAFQSGVTGELEPKLAKLLDLPPQLNYAQTWNSTQLWWELRVTDTAHALMPVGRLIVAGLSYQNSTVAEASTGTPENRNPTAYAILAGAAVFPWALPFDLPLQELRAFLEALGTSRSFLIDTARPQVRLTEPAAVSEWLSLSKTEWDLIVAAQSSGEPWKYWGLKKQDNEITDGIAGLVRTGPWPTILESLSLLLQQSGLSYREYLNFLQSAFAGRPAPVVFPPNECRTSVIQLMGLSPAAFADHLARLHAFTRLRRRTGWSVRELDLLLAAFGGQINAATAQDLALVKRIQKLTQLPALVIAACIDRLDARPWVENTVEGEPVTPSLYDGTFQRLALRRLPEFAGFASDQIDNSTSTLSERADFLAAALGVKAADILQWIGGTPSLGVADAVSLENLSRLFAAASLCKACAIESAKLPAVVALFGTEADPFRDSAGQTVRERARAILEFAERAQLVRESGLTIDAHLYLLRHRQPAGEAASNAADIETRLTDMLTELRSGLRAGPLLGDISLENLKLQLKLRGWYASLVESLAGPEGLGAPLSASLEIAPPLTPAPVIPVDLQSKFSYRRIDATRAVLQCSGSLAAADFARLPASIPAASVTELRTLYEDRQAERTQSLAQVLQIVALDALPTSTAAVSLAGQFAPPVIPEQFRDRLKFEIVGANAGRITLVGWLSDAERQTVSTAVPLLATVLTAVQTAANTLLPVTSPAASQMAERILRASDAQERFALVLLRMVPMVEGDAIAIKLAESLGIAADLIRLLLEKIAVLNRGAIEILTDAQYLMDALPQGVTRTSLPAQYRLAELLQKIATIVNALQITSRQAESMLLGSFDILDVRTLPVAAADPPAGFEGWRGLVKLARLRDALPDSAKSIDSINSRLAAGDFAGVRAALATVLEVDPAEVDAACAADLLNLTGAGPASDYRKPERLLQVVQLLQVIKQLGVPVATIRLLIAESPNESTARVARKIFASIIDPAVLAERLRPISNRLRNQQRDALVAYLVQRDGLRDASDLFERYLIDVEMGSCMRTSRLKQAISSVQLFVQRCLLNLERPRNAQQIGVSPDAIDTNRWSWMKSYRVWEANRKVFLYPENWIEPQLRDDKTEIFEAFESELLQNELTSDIALVAFRKYLDSLSDVVNLTVAALFEERLVDGGSIVHLVARDNSEPYKHYYRSWSLPVGADFGSWSAWEEITAQIAGEHVLVFVFGGSVYLAWPTIGAGQKGALNWKIGMNLAKRSASGWSKLKKARGEIEAPMVPTRVQRVRDERTSLAFLVNYRSDKTVAIEAYGPPVQATFVTPNETKKELVSEFFSADAEQNAGPGVSSPVITLKLRVLDSYIYEYSGNLKQTIYRLAQGVSITLTATYRTIQPKTGDLIGGWAAPVSQSMQPRSSNTPEYAFDDLIGTFVGLQTVQYKNLVGDTFSSLQMLASAVKITVQLKRNGVLLLERPIAIPKGNSLNWQEDFIIELTSDPGWLPTPVPYLLSRGEGGQLNFEVAPAGAPNLVRAGSFALRDDDSLELERENTYLTLETPPPGTEYFKSGFRDVGVDPNALAIDSRQALTTTPGQYFIVRARSEALSDNRFWSYRDDLSSLLFWRIHTQANYRVVPFSIGGMTDLKSNVTKGRLSEAIALPGSLAPRLLDIGSGVDLVNSVTRIGIEFSKTPTSIYEWEVFFHNPLMVATQLSQAQRFEEAQRWFHLVFDPTTSEPGPDSVRCWRFQPFRDAAKGEPIEDLLTKLARGTLDMSDEINEWALNPFRPHLIARQRIRAYQLTVVFKYVANLIAWGDREFRRDTIEAINEATQLYVLAAKILGRRPESSPRRTARARSYRDIQSKLDDFSNAWLPLEAVVATQGAAYSAAVKYVQTFVPDGELLYSLGSLYFCIPRNQKLDEYWDTVEQRLFDIRHCRNIDGVERKLPLFEPPIDPALLVRAVAAGLDLSAVLSDSQSPQPLYRFSVITQKALELGSEVRALGNSILSALEKRDAEQLAMLRSTHEIKMLGLVRAIKLQQKEEADANLLALRKTREIAVQRYLNYQRLLGKPNAAAPAENAAAILEFSSLQFAPPGAGGDDVEGLVLIATEASQLGKLRDANNFTIAAGIFNTLGGVAHALPNNTFGSLVASATWGGSNLGHAFNAVGSLFSMLASNASFEASTNAIIGGHQRRRDEWQLQSNTAAKDLEQIDRQILAGKIRSEIAAAEIANHDQQIENTQEVDEFMRDKFTNRDLYSWMVGQVSGMYFRTYQLAHDMAKRAERTYRFELGLADSNFVEFGYWDSLKKGLLCGERLCLDLKRMDASYLDKNRREFEITKHVSLFQLDPRALLQLKELGQCDIELPESLFDVDFPGHYLRRIKSLSLTIPCVVGPYSSVPCTVTQLKHSLRLSGNVSGKYARDLENDDPRFADSFGAIQSIVTSGAQNDSGLFETNLRDERYLPFEGAGVIGTWQLKMPSEFRQFDYETISDVILHIRYTSRDGGVEMKDAATTHLGQQIDAAEAAGMVRLFSVRQEFPSAWAKFKATEIDGNAVKTAELSLDLRAEHYPFWSQGRLKSVLKAEIFARVDAGVAKIEIAGKADATGSIDSLTPPANPSVPGVVAGTLSNFAPSLPVSAPNKPFKLYFKQNSVTELWLAIAWKGAA
jgi:hypothetical protein